MTDFLTVDDVPAAAEAHLGHPAEIGDYGLLESAVARPQATVFGDSAYPTIHEKAAAVLQSLVTNHALIDGDKRIAFVATAVFYELNGRLKPVGRKPPRPPNGPGCSPTTPRSRCWRSRT